MSKAAAVETEDKARGRVQQSLAQRLAQRMFQIANIRWIIEKQENFRKTSTSVY